MRPNKRFQTPKMRWLPKITGVLYELSLSAQGLIFGQASATLKSLSIPGVQDLNFAQEAVPGPIMKFSIVTGGVDETFTLPLGTSGEYEQDFIVYWGDTTSSIITAYDDPDITHTYSVADTYQITIEGTCEYFGFDNAGDKLKIITLDNLFNDPGFKIMNVYGCTNLTTIDSTFGVMASLTTAVNMFNNCGALTAIPSGLFDNSTSITSFSYCFYNCGILTAIPSGLFDNNTLSTSFSYCFYYCAALTTIPSGLFVNNTSVTSFSVCFMGCSSLVTIPTGLFNGATVVTLFNHCFKNCGSLTTIPGSLFDYASSVTAFNSLFESCGSIVTLPSGLFDNNATVETFERSFYGCTSLAAIPSGLFDFCTAVTSFEYGFYGCTSLAAIPSGLFDFCTAVTTFLHCFRSCTSLTAIPSGLFDNNVAGEVFATCFMSCTSLTTVIPSDILVGTTHTAVTTLDNMFGSIGVGYAAAAPTLWLEFTGDETHTDCFDGLTNASNYDDIPVDWK